MTSGPRPRGAMRLLLDPIFGPFVGGKLLSASGIWIHNIVAALLAYQLTGSAFVVGLVSVAQFGPQLLLMPWSGVQADRGDKKLQLVVGRLIMATGSGMLAVWLVLTGVDGLPGYWPIVLSAGIMGIGISTGAPAYTSVLPSLVRTGELAQAVTLSNVPPTLARAGGPAVGALVATTASPQLAFAISVIGNLACALILYRLPIDGRSGSVGGPDPRPIRTGLRYLRADPTVVLLLLGVVAIAVGSDPPLTLAPSLSERFGRGTDLVGIFVSSFGIGAAAAFLVVSPLRRWIGLPRMATLGLCLSAAGTLGQVFHVSEWLTIVLLGVTGVGMTISFTSLSVQIQSRVPNELRGRIMALWAAAYMAPRPFAAAFSGAVADAVSTEAAFAVVAVFVFGCAWLCRPSRMRPPPEGLLPGGQLT